MIIRKRYRYTELKKNPAIELDASLEDLEKYEGKELFFELQFTIDGCEVFIDGMIVDERGVPVVAPLMIQKLGGVLFFDPPYKNLNLG